MANSYKIVGQEDPANSLTDLYTVPASTEFVGTLFICNRTSNPVAVRASVAVGGASDDPTQYLIQSYPVPANDTLIINGVSLAATDVVRCYADVTGVSFTLMGVQIQA